MQHSSYEFGLFEMDETVLRRTSVVPYNCTRQQYVSARCVHRVDFSTVCRASNSSIFI